MLLAWDMTVFMSGDAPAMLASTGRTVLATTAMATMTAPTAVGR